MKKLFFAFALMAISAGVTSAQQPACANQECTATEACGKNCNGKCDKPCQRPCEFEGLNLTEQQQAQIKAIQEEQRAKCAKDKADCKAQKEARAEQRRACRAEYLAKIKSVLTPEQYTAYLENCAKMHHGKKGAKRFKHGEGRRVCDKGPRCPQPEKK